MIGFIILNISKAFDTIDHSILLMKLRKVFSLSDSSCQWVESYLQNLEQAVRFAGILSPTCPITADIPWGFVLGPTLFSCSSMICHNILHLLLLQCPKSLLLMYKNGLTLNIPKTKTMLIHPPSKRPPPLIVSYNDSLIDQVQVFKLLGVFVDQHLK